MTKCAYCNIVIPETRRADAKFCCDAHKLANHKREVAMRDLDPLEQLKAAIAKINALEESLRLAQEHCRELVNRHNLNRNPEAQRLLHGDQDWPDDNRIDAIGQNGPTGEHYSA